MKVTGAVVFVRGWGVAVLREPEEGMTPTTALPPIHHWTPRVWSHTGGHDPGPVDEIPPADGYLLVDIREVPGLLSCMLACSLVHEGVESLSLSRIQICRIPSRPFPTI